MSISHEGKNTLVSDGRFANLFSEFVRTHGGLEALATKAVEKIKPADQDQVTYSTACLFLSGLMRGNLLGNKERLTPNAHTTMDDVAIHVGYYLYAAGVRRTDPMIEILKETFENFEYPPKGDFFVYTNKRHRMD